MLAKCFQYFLLRGHDDMGILATRNPNMLVTWADVKAHVVNRHGVVCICCAWTEDLTQPAVRSSDIVPHEGENRSWSDDRLPLRKPSAFGQCHGINSKNIDSAQCAVRDLKANALVTHWDLGIAWIVLNGIPPKQVFEIKPKLEYFPGLWPEYSRSITRLFQINSPWLTLFKKKVLETPQLFIPAHYTFLKAFAVSVSTVSWRWRAFPRQVKWSERGEIATSHCGENSLYWSKIKLIQICIDIQWMKHHKYTSPSPKDFWELKRVCISVYISHLPAHLCTWYQCFY